MEVKRNIGLDLLRILSMLMIVMLHYLGKGGALATEYGSKVNYISWVLEAFCIVAVNCYVYVTGYFMVNSNFKIKKVLKLWGQVLFYSITIYLVLVFTKLIDFNIQNMLFSFIPIVTKQYWFITVYFLLYILSPFLNVMIHNLSKLQFKKLIAVMLFVFCICVTFMRPTATIDMTNGYGIVWFICLYFIGAYIKLYNDDDNKKNIVNLLIYIGITILVILSRFFITYINSKFSIELLDISNRLTLDLTDKVRFYNYNSITIFLSSLFLFLFFKNLRINSNVLKSCILKIAPLTLGVYLIHDNINLWVVLYRDIIHTSNYLDSRYFIFISILYVVCIFIVCIIIEYLRHKVAVYLGKTKLYNKLEKYVVMEYNKFSIKE